MEDKRCDTCKLPKPPTEFNKNRARKDGLNSICRECSKARSRQYYKDHPDKHKQNVAKNNKRYREEVQAKMVAYLKDHPCCDCNNDDIRVLEFDHLRDKEYPIAQMLAKAYPWERILKEIEKCEVVCANCHKIRTCERGGFYRSITKTMGA